MYSFTCATVRRQSVTLRSHSKIVSLTVLGCGNWPVSVGNRRELEEDLGCLGAIFVFVFT